MKILLVDDNEINLELEKLMLESYGLSVETATNGEDAVELVWGNEYSMIFMDIHMPGISGYEASAEIRKFNADVPILAVSADKISDDDECFIKSGMNGSLRKPLQLAELKEKIGSLSDLLDNARKPEKWKADIIFDYHQLQKTIPDKKAIFQVLQQFLSLHKNDCEQLKCYIDSGDYLSAREIIHNIKGVSGNLVCRQLYTASNRLGNELRRERADSFENFTKVWTQTIAELSEYCSKLSERYKDNDDTQVEWSKIWKHFVQLCGDFDISATKLFMENIKAFEDNLDGKLFESIKKAINVYDFLSIAEELEGLNV